MTVFLLLWQLITALQVFDLVYVTTKGGPLGSTTVIVYFVWQQAFQMFTAGYGAAAAYVLALALLVAGVALRVVRRRRGASWKEPSDEHTDDGHANDGCAQDERAGRVGAG